MRHQRLRITAYTWICSSTAKYDAAFFPSSPEVIVEYTSDDCLNERP